MNVLVTGTSGSGKSAVGKILKERGFDVIEIDTDTFKGLSIAYWRDKSTGQGVNMPWPPPENWHTENDWVWRVNVLSDRLNFVSDSITFACGDSRNKSEAYSLFDKIFVLKVNDDTLGARIQSRNDNYFGKAPSEFKWITEQNKTIANEVRKAGGIVIDANNSINKVVDSILEFVKK
jgi:gluconate kinase